MLFAGRLYHIIVLEKLCKKEDFDHTFQLNVIIRIIRRNVTCTSYWSQIELPNEIRYLNFRMIYVKTLTRVYSLFYSTLAQQGQEFV